MEMGCYVLRYECGATVPGPLARRAIGYGCLLRGTVTFRGCRCASPARAAQDDLERKAAARQKTREGSKQAAVREKYGLNKRA